jgi:CheY-like chemotaxis protein
MQSVRALLARILSEEGYEGLEAADGMEALKLMQQHATSCQLVITDVIMPRLNGPALAQHLTALSPHVKILFISGYTGDTVFNNGVGKDAFLLQKPIMPQVLTEKVEEILRNC